MHRFPLWNTSNTEVNMHIFFFTEMQFKLIFIQKCIYFDFYQKNICTTFTMHLINIIFFFPSSLSLSACLLRLPLEVVQRREKKWLIMLRNWDRFMQSKWVKIRDRCRKGIPESVRGQAWYHLCAAHKHSAKNPNLFALLDQQPGNHRFFVLLICF